MPASHKDEKIVEETETVRKDPFHQLCQYWEVTDAENPTYADLYDNRVEGVYNYPGIIFMTDSTFLENPRAETNYGRFIFKGKIITAEFDNNKKATYTIESKQNDTMIVRRVENNHVTKLYLKGSKVFWTDASLNPFNKVNSQWRIKPPKAENNDEIRKRLKNCVQFYEYFFQGYANGESTEIDFLGLPTCFKWYQGAIYVLSVKNLDKKWVNCFYSEGQAIQARQIMEDAVTTKKYDWDTTQRNWIKQTAGVLKQIKNNL